jgi:hypothetical protein
MGRGEACRPVLANQAEIERALSTGVEAYLRSRPEALLPTRPVVVDVMVDTTGAAAGGEARIHQISGIPELDRLALEVAALMRFHPARLNGAAVPVWSRIPLTLRVERSRTPPEPLGRVRVPSGALSAGSSTTLDMTRRSGGAQRVFVSSDGRYVNRR